MTADCSHDEAPPGPHAPALPTAAGSIAAAAMTRRAALGAGLAGVGALALASCSGGSGRSDSGASAAASAGATAGASADGGRGAILALSAIPVGGSRVADGPGGSKVVVTRTGASSAVCHSAICTHLGCTVAPAGAQLHCPCHGSVYDARSGKVLAGPAPRPLPAVPVQVVHGQVVAASG